MNTSRTKISPPTLAKMWGVGVDKILGFIRRGELRAFDVSVRHGVDRSRFLIDPRDVETFELSRMVIPPPPRPVRRRCDPSVKKFFDEAGNFVTLYPSGVILAGSGGNEPVFRYSVRALVMVWSGL